MSVLCYHSVNDEWDSPLAMPSADFVDQCRWLSRARTVHQLDRLVERLDHRGRPPRGTTALTFDDGLSDLYDAAWPVLRRYRLPWTVFLVAETLTAEGRSVDWVDTPPQWPLQTLTREQVEEMRDAGVSFASHSWAHRDLTTLGEQECERDLRASRELLEDLLDEPVDQLAYPRGRHCPHVRRAAKRAGYRYAFGLPTEHERPGRYSLPRAGLFRGNGVGELRVKSQRRYVEVRTHPVVTRLRGR